MSWEMAEVYGAVTDQILINLAKYFPYYNSVDELPRSAFTYQAQMLAQMGQVNRETVKIIRNGLKDADDALKGCLEAAIMESVRKSEPELYKAVKAGILAVPTTPVVSPNQMRAFQLYYKQAADKLNLVNTVMLESTGSAYRQAVTDVVSSIELADKMNRTQIALDVGAGETITGVSSWNQAVKHSIDKMKDGGITGFIDHGGHRWSAEAYTAMDIRTTVANTARAAVWETNQNFGNDLYLVSTHDGARPLCYPWQNKVISAMNIARDVVDLYGNPVHVYAQNETTYGMPAGLFGINCGHMADPFIPGVSTVNGHPQNPEENEKDYKESQEQRRLERKLREEKRDLAMAKAQGASDEEIKRLRDKCRNTSSDIDDFCDKTGRARHRDRETVYTQREFPEAKSYDVSKFETEQKEKIQEYYQTGGAQKQFTFGQMVPNVPLVPTPTPTPTPAPAVVPENKPEPVAQAETQTAEKPKPEKIERQTDLLNVMERNDVERVPVARYETQPTEQQIIGKICGWDKTNGSCVSTALAYTGNVNGLDVTDFRGGDSQYAFSKGSTVRELLKLKGVDGRLSTNANDFTTAHDLLKGVEPGKQYFLTVGKHAAIVRRGASGIEYLELQGDVAHSGWFSLTDNELRYRFGCQRSHTFMGSKYEKTGVLFDIASVKGNREFEDVLEFINTAADAQQKGVGGGYR
jgi:hypothetical protein